MSEKQTYERRNKLPKPRLQLRIIGAFAALSVVLILLGDLWVDDLTLEIEGGEPLPDDAPFELVYEEDFAKARLPSKWKTSVGATNGPTAGDGSTDSAIEIDPDSGAGSPRSLRLSGDLGTTRWQALHRDFKADPGELYRLSAMVKAEDVRREGRQYANLHLNLTFLDRRGEAIGKTRFGSAESGTHDWAEVAVEAISPDGTKKVRSGLFLSMSGTAWFDDLVLQRKEGVPVPYGDWPAIEKEGIVR